MMLTLIRMHQGVLIQNTRRISEGKNRKTQEDTTTKVSCEWVENARALSFQFMNICGHKETKETALRKIPERTGAYGDINQILSTQAHWTHTHTANAYLARKPPLTCVQCVRFGGELLQSWGQMNAGKGRHATPKLPSWTQDRKWLVSRALGSWLITVRTGDNKIIEPSTCCL